LALHVFLFFLIVFFAWLWHLYWLHHKPPHSRVGTIHIKIQCLLKPHTPLDCPACRLSSTLSSDVEPAPLPVRPWREVKSRRGSPKRIDTQGFAYPNHQYRQATITSLSDSRWRVRTDLARALLPQPLAPPSAVGRTANQTALLHTGDLALAGYRSSHEDSSRALSRPPHPTCGAHGHPLLSTTLDPWLAPTLHQRWPQFVLLRASQPILDSGSIWFAEEGKHAGGKWRRA
jgi:hypothetical protein